MKYHTRTFRLLDREPRISPEAVAEIERCEARCGARFPAAVREWYSLEGVEEVLAQRNQACGPNSLAGVIDDFADAARGGRRGRVPFYGPWAVNTGYEAAVVLDGSDDPPVEVDPPARPQTFSEFVLGTTWWRLTLDSRHVTVFGRGTEYFGAEVGPRQLAFLVGQFEELPREVDAEFNFSYWPRPEPFELRTYRFFRPGRRVKVQTDGDPATAGRPAAFILAADADELLFNLYREVWPCHGRLVCLGPHEATDHEAFVARFRARFPEAEVLAS